MATYNSINDYINREVRGSTSLVPAQGTSVTTFEPSKEFMDLVKATILQARASMNNNDTSGLDELNKNLEEIKELLKSIVSASAEMRAEMQKNLDNIEIPLLESESARKRMELDKTSSTSLVVIEERLNKIIEYYEGYQKREIENKDKDAIESERRATRRNALLDKFFTWASDLLGTIKDFAKQFMPGWQDLLKIGLALWGKNIPRAAQDFFNPISKSVKLIPQITGTLVKSIGKMFNKIGKYIKSFGKSFEGLGKLFRIGGLGAAKVGGKIASKTILKRIPLIGSIISIVDAVTRWREGDKFGATIDCLSAIANLLGPWGMGISIILDLVNVGRDFDWIGKATDFIETKTDMTPEQLERIPFIGAIYGILSSIKNKDKLGVIKHLARLMPGMEPFAQILYKIYDIGESIKGQHKDETDDKPKSETEDKPFLEKTTDEVKNELTNDYEKHPFLTSAANFFRKGSVPYNENREMALKLGVITDEEYIAGGKGKEVIFKTAQGNDDKTYSYYDNGTEVTLTSEGEGGNEKTGDFGPELAKAAKNRMKRWGWADNAGLGHCGKAVGDAVCAIFGSSTGNKLRGHGADWAKTLSSDVGKSYFDYKGQEHNLKNLNNVPAGSILSWPRTKKHKYGHVEIADGKGNFISDFGRQWNNGLNMTEGSFRPHVFTPKDTELAWHVDQGTSPSTTSTDVLASSNTESSDLIASDIESVDVESEEPLTFEDMISNAYNEIAKIGETAKSFASSDMSELYNGIKSKLPSDINNYSKPQSQTTLIAQAPENNSNPQINDAEIMLRSVVNPGITIY